MRDVRIARNKAPNAPSYAELGRRKDITSLMSACCTSARSRTTNHACEQLENDTTSTVPKNHVLMTYKGVSEDTTFEDGCDSDGYVGPFFDAVEDEKSKMKCVMKHSYYLTHLPIQTLVMSHHIHLLLKNLPK